MADIQIVPVPEDANVNESKVVDAGNGDENTAKEPRSSLRKRLTGLLGKKKDEQHNAPVLAYKQGSLTETFFQESRGRSSEENDVQLALAMSLRNEQDNDMDKEEREALALAKALSLSETENDDIILRQVLERSKEEADYLTHEDKFADIGNTSRLKDDKDYL